MSTNVERIQQQFAAMRPILIENAVKLLGDYAHWQAPRAPHMISHKGLRVDSGAKDISDRPVVMRVWSLSRVRSMLNRLVEPTTSWIDYGGNYLAFAQSYYAHRTSNRLEEYFAHAESRNRIFRATFPDLLAEILEYTSKLIGEPVSLRDGWSGPGFVTFRAGASNGYPGDIHVDWEGWTVAELLDPKLTAFTGVVMLQRPTFGGDLRIWNVRFKVPGFHSSPTNTPEYVAQTVPLQPGEMVFFNGFSLHQIGSFHGSRDRINCVFHVGKSDDRWKLWF